MQLPKAIWCIRGRGDIQTMDFLIHSLLATTLYHAGNRGYLEHHGHVLNSNAANDIFCACHIWTCKNNELTITTNQPTSLLSQRFTVLWIAITLKHTHTHNMNANNKSPTTNCYAKQKQFITATLTESCSSLPGDKTRQFSFSSLKYLFRSAHHTSVQRLQGNSQVLTIVLRRDRNIHNSWRVSNTL